jgi:phage terminase large subunit GpA-like protein
MSLANWIDDADGAEFAARRLARALRSAVPPPPLKVSEWADKNRVLTKEASAEPGAWSTARAPYQEEILNSVLEPDVEQVVVCSSSQVGKTEILNNIIGYFIDMDPSPMLLVQPTVELAQAWSKDRFAPMIAATPALAEKVRDAKSRDSENTILHKVFTGGHLSGVGANAPSALAMRPVRLVLCDEVDRFPSSAGTEGDPISLAIRRTDTFWNRKIVLVSTPTLKDVSRIEEAYLASDMRRFYVPCPKCQHRQVLRFDRLMWEKDEHGRPIRDSVVYRCEACAEALAEQDKEAMLAGGSWLAEQPGRRTRGYHLNSLLSPWRMWADIAEEFHSIGKNKERLKVFVNTVLGETWEERGDAVKADALKARLERYDAEVPDGVGLLVASVDVQGDRLEALVVGFGAGEEAWILAFEQMVGDPATEAPWNALEVFLKREFLHASGRNVRVEVAVVDSGGAHTEEVYKHTKAYQAGGSRVYPIKGGNITGQPLVGRPSRSNTFNVPLFVLCVDAGKESILARLRLPAPGHGYIHLPEWLDDEFLEQLTAEKAVRKYIPRRGSVRAWVKVRERNEAFDLMVYALAALYIAGAGAVRELPDRAAAFSVRVEPKPVEDNSPAAPAAPTFPRPMRSSWVNSWRK